MFNRNEITDASLIHRPIIGAAAQRFPWTELEEYQPDGGMWSIPGTREVAAYVAATAEVMRDIPEFKRAMRRALTEWPKSCAVAMTTPGLNKRAWLGHAGCYLATGSPEETTRLGWHDLNDDQQRQANAAADFVIAEWHRLNAHAKQAADDQIGLFDA
jgi:hypothetical protein